MQNSAPLVTAAVILREELGYCTVPMMSTRRWIFAFCICVGAAIVLSTQLILRAGEHGQSPIAAKAGGPAHVSVPVPVAPYTAWSVDRSVNPVTGTVTVTAVDDLDGDHQLVFRRTGSKLECFVATNQFLETMDNVETGDSTVRYRFDGGSPVRQTWSLSENKEALFYPGNPSGFLKRLARAKRFAFQYAPADYEPVAVTFDVRGFPVFDFGLNRMQR